MLKLSSLLHFEPARWDELLQDRMHVRDYFRRQLSLRVDLIQHVAMLSLQMFQEHSLESIDLA